MTDGLADAMWPAWDASGKYLWFLASTDFGLASQWLDMTSYDHDADVRAVLRDSQEGRADAAAAGERRGSGVQCRPVARRRWWPGRRRGGRAGGAAGRRSGGRAQEPTRAPPRVPSPCRSISTTSIAASSRCPACRSRDYSQLRAGGRRHRSTTSRRRAGGGGSHAAPVPSERSPRGAVRHRRRRLRRSAPTAHKLLYRGGGGGGGRGGGGGGGSGRRARRCSSSTPIALRRRRAPDG